MITKEDIIETIKYQQKHISPQIRFDKELTNTVYKILYGIFCLNKKYVLIQAPTGSGKSIIGFVTARCIHMMREKEQLYKVKDIKDKQQQYLEKLRDEGASNEKILAQSSINEEYLLKIGEDFLKFKDCYYLTSSKILQEQIDKDIARFEFGDMCMLKGQSNYPCNLSHYKIKLLNISPEEKEEKLRFASYQHRECMGVSSAEMANDPTYSKCMEKCEYRLKRAEASRKDIAVLNYHYGLSIMNMINNPYFSKRFLTICDEAHKLSQIIDDMYTCEVNVNILDSLIQIVKKLQQLRYEKTEHSKFFSEDVINELKSNFKKFNGMNITFIIDFIKQYHDEINAEIEPMLNEVLAVLTKDKIRSVESLIHKTNNVKESFSSIKSKLEHFIDILQERPTDIFYHIEQYKNTEYKLVQIKDLNETSLLQDKFVKKCDNILFMSATMGDLDEFAEIYGLNPDECIAIKLPNKFDFSTSPIYLTNSGNLRMKDFNQNIDKCLDDVIDICLKLHPNDKGIIHTHTFNINNLLRNKASGNIEFMKRAIFYDSALEKERAIKSMYNTQQPLIIIGPSLVEGLDLKDDLARFNILIKVPYMSLTDYVKAKMNYCSFWYERNCKETIVQSIGRTNRHIKDQSTVYLIDSMFSKIITKIDDVITSRIKYLNLNNVLKRDFEELDIDEVISKRIEKHNIDKIYNSAMSFTNSIPDSFEGDLPF